MRDFVRENREVLERVPSAFFSVSMTAREGTEEACKKVEEYVEGFAQETGWHPERVGVFAGAIPYTRYGFVKKRLIRSMAKEMGVGTDISRDFEYTDWEAVRHYTEEFLEEVARNASPGSSRSYEYKGR
ncbi:flavodoxin domain-containing protein [Rubrobacter marinus]|uniref:flavodoxin domain-containing protein n=1 Tax=Rubrobacter marinus TaxID=2653852 RepID=UPI001A9CD320